MTYGFDTRLVNNRSNQDISDLAEFLRRAIEAMRDEARAWVDFCAVNGPSTEQDHVAIRPLIFIGHSLGGLIVKEVIKLLSGLTNS
jgi:hypothetical protein